MTKQKVFESIFNAEGNFVVLGYDPHYCQSDNPSHMALHHILFDADGNLNEELDGNLTDDIQDLREYIEEQSKNNPSFGPLCDAVHLYFAEMASSATNQQYSVASLFKR